jgi:hypothetical protein
VTDDQTDETDETDHRGRSTDDQLDELPYACQCGNRFATQVERDACYYGQ